MPTPAVLAVLAAAVTLLPVLAAAQGASPRTDLRMETTRRRVVVRPDPPVAQALEDAARAADEAAVRRLAEQAGPAIRPPQLDEDVTRAIQARNLQRALRR
jgi:hypothetical protein